MTKGNSDHDILHPMDCAEWHLWSLRISKIIARAWTDKAFKAQLIAEPARALKDAGLAVPEGAEVVVEDGATQWSIGGSALNRVDRLVLPLPPKPKIDSVLKAWANGETGHPPILASEGEVAFSGVPAIEDSAARRVAEARRVGDARRVGEARRVAEGRRVVEDEGTMAAGSAARRVGAARRIVDEADFEASDAVARRMAEGRRVLDDWDEGTADAEARRVAEGRRVVEPGAPESDSAARRVSEDLTPSEGRRVADEPPAEDSPAKPAASEARRTAEGRRVAKDQPASKPTAKKGTRKPGKK